MATESLLPIVELGDRRGLPDEPLAWLRQLGGPRLLRIAGRDRSRLRAVSTLLHGNEPSGLRGVHGWLRSAALPATDVLLFVGAVDAALAAPAFSHRFLPGQRDLNRCFRPPFEGPEGRLAGALLARLEQAAPEALVDVHNNTGHNPPYGVGPRAGAIELTITELFGTRFIHSDFGIGAIIEATHSRFPSVTVECGRSGDPAADAVARRGLERFLAMEHIEPSRSAARLEILMDPVRVCLTDGARLAFGEEADPQADLTVSADVDRHNFEWLGSGTTLGWLASGAGWPLEARAPGGGEVSREIFAARDGRLETLRPLIPMMMTTNPAVALADCLFYAVIGEDSGC